MKFWRCLRLAAVALPAAVGGLGRPATALRLLTGRAWGATTFPPTHGCAGCYLTATRTVPMIATPSSPSIGRR